MSGCQRRRVWTALLAGSTVAATLVLATPAGAAAPPPTTAMVSLFTGSPNAGLQGGFSPSISGDGRFVAFESRSRLAGINTGGVLQVYVRDRKNGRTILVSRANGSKGAIGNAFSDAPSISADGRYVAFESSAHNLVSGFTPVDRTACDDSSGQFLGDIYLRDLVKNTTVLVGHANGNIKKPGDFYTEDPYISSDGSAIVFASAATNIATDGGPTPVGGCPNPQLYVYKLADGSITMVRPDDGSVPDGPVDAYAVSGNGKVVAFSTAATNLVAAGSQPADNAYVFTMSTKKNELVSRASGASGATANGGAGSVTVNGDGSKVVFASEAGNLGVTNPSGFQHVYLRNRTAKTTSLVSATTSGSPGNGDSGPAAISYDGRFVAFETGAPNLGGFTATSSPFTEITQIDVRDLSAKTTTLVSRASGASTAKANKDGAEDVAISRDGKTVGFESDATNLVKRSNQQATQVFVRSNLYRPPLTSRAKIRGTVKVASTVNCAVGFTKPVSVSYVWLNNGKPIAKASGRKFKIPASLKGHSLKCRALGTRGDGTAVSTSRGKKVQPK